MSTLYSIEESLERAAITVLKAKAELAGCRIVSADESDEDTLPCIYVRAERLEELVLGMQTWNCRLAISLCTAADETPQSDKNLRRLPDSDDDDTGVTGFKSLWKTLYDLVDASQFVTDLNAQEIVKVWGLEFDPVSYENQNRSFSRSINARIWANEAYPAA